MPFIPLPAKWATFEGITSVIIALKLVVAAHEIVAHASRKDGHLYVVSSWVFDI